MNVQSLWSPRDGFIYLIISLFIVLLFLQLPEFLDSYIKLKKISEELTMISNSNWSEWSTIQGVIGRVISNLKLRARLLPELYDTRSNY